MLTRLKVSGFKNLVDVDIRFGPVTCIAGANGVGKSNLFDAITFLSALTDRPILDAALSVRDEGGRTSDVRSLFQRVGDAYANEMTLEAEMIIPPYGQDDLGQEAKANITFVRYALSLRYRQGESFRSLGSLEIVSERLSHINLSDARENLHFPHTKSWRESVVSGRRSGGDFISTTTDPGNRVIKVHQDGAQGRPRTLLPATLPRTVLSATNAAESPTALLARNEMKSWRLLQLEPSALRTPDPFTAPTHMRADGAHLPATLYHLAQSHDAQERSERGNDEQNGTGGQVYAQVANRLADLISDVTSVWIDRDDTRELLTLYLRDRYGTSHAARSLSDGTLRFLALAVLEIDPEGTGLLCLEEPENGIHPERIPAMLQLLSDLAVDPTVPVGPDNTLRQIVINTHSPAVVSQIVDDELVVAELAETVQEGQRFNRVKFGYLPETWRARDALEASMIVAKGKLLAYLNPVAPSERDVPPHTPRETQNGHTQRRRVVDRPDIQPLLWSHAELEGDSEDVIS